MNRASHTSQRFILALLMFIILVTALVAPSIIDLYTGAPQAKGSEANEVVIPVLSSESIPLKITEEPTQLDQPTVIPSTTPISPSNCTMPLDFWRSHPDSWPAQGMTFGSLVLDKKTSLDILNSTAEDVRIIVLRELIVYSLNTLHGADPSPVTEVVGELGDWLIRNGNAGNISEPDRQRGYALAAELSVYNQGLAGPSPCPETTDTPIPTVTATASPTLSPTPSPTNTNVPPTRRPPLTIPTATNKPNPPPQPTAAPTLPPPPPTAVPTQPPPPTAIPTQPPPPTSVPTSVSTPTSPP